MKCTIAIGAFLAIFVAAGWVQLPAQESVSPDWRPYLISERHNRI